MRIHLALVVTLSAGLLVTCPSPSNAGGSAATEKPTNGAQAPESTGGGLAVGRILYKKIAPPPTSLKGYEYVGLRLQIRAIGGEVTDATAPGWASRLFSLLFKETESVFVGLRFTSGPYEVIDDIADNGQTTQVPAVPFFAVLRAVRSSASATQAETHNNSLVLGPRQVGSGDIVLQLAVRWGTQTETTIPAALIEVGKIVASAYGAGLPTLMANGLVSMTNADRSKANDFFNRALSFSSADLTGSNGPSGVNSETLTNDDLQRGVGLEVRVFDKDARQADKKEVVHFMLMPEYRPSVLPHTPVSAPADPKTLFMPWVGGDYRGQLVTGSQYRNTTVDKLLASVPGTGTQTLKNLGENNTFGDACTALPTAYARLGFNTPDQYGLTWGILKDAKVLQGLRFLQPAIAKGVFQTQPQCPDDSLNAAFESWGLPRIASPQEALGIDLKSLRIRFLSFAFARAWARQSSFETFFSPDNDNLVLIDQDGSSTLLDAASPASSEELINSLAKIRPTSVGTFTRLASGTDTWCAVITVKTTKYKGAIDFEPESTFVRRIAIGKPAGCPEPQ